MPLTDRSSLLREFYRVTGTSGSDGAAIKHDKTGVTLEGIYNLLQHGAWDAQLFLLQIGEADRWLTTTSGTITWSGSDATGGRYTALETDVLRLAGDQHISALRYPNGDRWGQLIEFRDRSRATGSYYWLQEDDLWIARGAAPPSDLQYDYHEKLATLADDETVDFPEEHRPLIVAFAADRASDQAWFPLDDMGKAIVKGNLRNLKRKARAQIRRTMQPRSIRRPVTTGRWWR